MIFQVKAITIPTEEDYWLLPMSVRQHRGADRGDYWLQTRADNPAFIEYVMYDGTIARGGCSPISTKNVRPVLIYEGRQLADNTVRTLYGETWYAFGDHKLLCDRSTHRNVPFADPSYQANIAPDYSESAIPELLREWLGDRNS